MSKKISLVFSLFVLTLLTSFMIPVFATHSDSWGNHPTPQPDPLKHLDCVDQLGCFDII